MQETQIIEYKESWRDEYLKMRIANAFFRAGFIESWGRGIKEIRSICKEFGAKEPEFQVDQDCVFVNFYPLESMKDDSDVGTIKSSQESSQSSQESSQSSQESLQSSQEDSQESSQKNSQKILELIAKNREITTQEIANHLGISRRAVANHIKNLQDKKTIQHIGPNKGGHWEIIEKES